MKNELQEVQLNEQLSNSEEGDKLGMKLTGLSNIEKVHVDLEALHEKDHAELVDIIQRLVKDRDRYAIHAKVYKYRAKQHTISTQKRINAIRNEKRRIEGKIGYYRRNYNYMQRKMSRMKTEHKRNLEEARKMKYSQLKAKYENENSIEHQVRSPRTLAPAKWARILHRANVIKRTSGLGLGDIACLMYLYKREKVTTDDYAYEMNEKWQNFNQWMTKFRKKGWVNSERRLGRYKIHYLTVQGNDMAKKVYDFIKKNPTAGKKKPKQTRKYVRKVKPE